MPRLNDRERKLVIGAGVFLGAVFAYLFVLQPFLASRNELNERLDSSYRLYRNYLDVLANEATYKERYESRKSDIMAVSRLLLSGNTSSLAAAELSNKIRDYADQTGISITRENVNDPVPIDHHQQISIQLNMSCDIIALRDFLKKIEDDSNLLIVNSLEVNAPASMRRSFRKGNYPGRSHPMPENLRVTMTISGFIEGDDIGRRGEGS